MSTETVVKDYKNPKLKRGSLGNNMVSQHNHLVTASYELTLTEKRLLLACISKINSTESFSSTTPFNFDLVEGAELFGYDLSNSGVIAAFKDAAEGLRVTAVSHSKVSGWIETSILQGYEYHYDTKVMSVYFSHLLIPYLSDLKTTFTTFRLLHIGKLSSQHSIRLYELLVMFLNKNYGKPCHKKMKLTEFKELMNCENVYKKNFAMFRVKVVETAINQINAETDIDVSVKYEKNGKKGSGRFFTHIVLDFSKKSRWKDAENEFKQILSDDQIEKILNDRDFLHVHYDFYQAKGGKDGVLGFFKEAKKLLKEDPKKHFSDYADYLKDK
ncbi:MAG: replication initiation protein [Proteus vulgaris]